MNGKSLVLLLAIGLVSVANASTDHKTSCVNKFVQYFSSFFSTTQVGTYADAGMGQIIVHANSSDIVSAVINKAWNSLTTTQYTKGSTLLVSGASAFGSYSAINATIQKCISGAAPVLLKLYPKVWKKIKAQSSSTNKLAAGYLFADKKFTLALSKKLVKKCKAKLTSSEWSKGTSILKSYINFSTLGYSV